MTDLNTVSPALSTAQDESSFSFDRVKASTIRREHLNLDITAKDDEVRQRIRAYYSIHKLISLIGERIVDDNKTQFKYKRVTIQFPDELIGDSAIVVQEIQKKLNLKPQNQDCESDIENLVSKHHCSGSNNNECCGNCTNPVNGENSDTQKIWILADTSYSSCCVDEVAASHVNSDLVIHVGDACLNSVRDLPVAYVLGQPSINFEKLEESFRLKYEHDKGKKIIIMANAQNSRHLSHLYETLKPEYKNLAYADLSLDSSKNVKIIDYSPSSEGILFSKLNRRIIGTNLNEENVNMELGEFSLFHISVPHSPRLLALTTIFDEVTLFDTEKDVIENGNFPKLMRRYRNMHISRAAGTIGILMNTLSLEYANELLDLIKKRVSEYGKKYYVLVVGKPNVAKLANFESIDIWCVLGCDHQGIIIDEYNEYFKPVITPYELLLALSEEHQWTGKWVTDFRSVVADFKQSTTSEVPEVSDASTTEDDPDAPIFDPVTGTYNSVSKPLHRFQHLNISLSESEAPDDNENSLVTRPNGSVVIRNTISTSATVLQNRLWTGLGSDFSELENDTPAVVEEGIKGIARGYEFDKKASI